MTSPCDGLPPAPLKSEFSSDPDMAELVEGFVVELPSRIEALIQALQAQSVTDVKRLSHQLKGAAGGYGFQSLGEAAGKVEHALITSTQPADVTLASIQTQVRALLHLCYRAALTAPGPAPKRPSW